MPGEGFLQDASERSGERFELLAKASHDSIWDWSWETGTLWWNEHFTRLSGCKPGSAAAVPETWYNRIHPADRDPILKSIYNHISNGITNWEAEYRFLRANDTYAHIFNRAYTLYEHGRPVRMIGSMQDVSTLVQLQRQNDEEKERTRFALNAAELGTWDLHLLNNVVRWDDRCKELYGFSKNDVVPYEEVLTYIHPDDMERVRDAVSRALNPASGGQYDIRFRTIGADDKRLRWLHCKGKAYFSETGEAIRFSGTAQDITHEIKTREQVTSAENLARLAVEAAGAGSFHTDLLTNRLTYSPTLAKILTGTLNAGLTRDSMAAHIHPEDMALRLRGLELGERSGNLAYEVRFIWDDGSIHWIRIKGTYSFNDAGEPILYSGIALDITEEVKAREEQQKLLSLVENSSDYMAMINEAGDMIYMNPTGRRLLGLSEQDDITQYANKDFFTEADFDFLTNTIAPAVTQNGRWSGNVVLKQVQTGELIPFYGDFLKVNDPLTGKYLGRSATLRDLRPEQAVTHALAESEKRFRSMISIAPVAMMVLRGKDLVIETINQAMLDMVDKTADITGLPFDEGIPAVKDKPIIGIMQQVMQTGQAFSGWERPFTLVRNGREELCYFNFTLTPLYEAGKITGILEVASEITGIVQARTALEQSEKRFRSLVIDNPTATVVFHGRDMQVELINHAMLQVWHKDESVVGKPLLEALPEMNDQPFLRLLQRVYDTGQPYHDQEGWAKIMVNGRMEQFWFNFAYSPIYNETGEIYGVINTATDVTAQVLARLKLEETEDRLRDAVELASLGTWEQNVQTGIVSWSRRLQDWYGIPRNQVPASDIHASMNEADQQRIQAAIARAVAPGAAGIFNEEYTIRNQQNGRQRVLHSQGKVFWNDTHTECVIRGTSLDITARKMIERELEQQVLEKTEELQAINETLMTTNEELQKTNKLLNQSNKELEQYAYVASHDLQEPLRKIRIFSDLLNNIGNLPGEAKPVLQKIIHSASRMSLLIRDLLEFSQLLQAERDMQTVSLDEVLQNVLVDFELVIQEKAAVITCTPLPVLEAVPLQMNQLLYNLLGNALKFTSRDVRPRISITAQELTPGQLSAYAGLMPHGTYYSISITDNGIGFDTQYAEQIFEVFKRLHTRDIYPGSGIGLALCRKIVQNHNGLLQAFSTPGQGTTIVVVLPVHQTAA